ncbi:hypothetical protein LAZ67_8003299 [Cordylochernes scorpioides]|uniref:Uncharacterized protein n=1 Tax=Cordylochernes scorpioides TaxID=51811 RepID=A0ABY6KS69_9ARAC|nr:hypothetical protein LAZ67_8003299 [Cordylochernes scorpioides]
MKSLRCLHASISKQQQCPLSWVCKAAAQGPCQFSARLRPLLGMRICGKPGRLEPPGYKSPKQLLTSAHTENLIPRQRSLESLS